ncbi:FGGY family carbohydrate kinase [Nonomuraea sp. NPDC004580]|uniref:FGGY-family carbohydrate kinase n=1 Tax=Nonomuraea sp. NPDC004580 TaxID=3154552 RepID=UPI0033A3C651
MTPNGLLAGIDVGTTHVKVGFFDEWGGEAATVRRRTPSDLPALVKAVTDALGECAERAGRGPEAIGIAGMAETGVPLDVRGRPLTPLIWWNDPRGAEEIAGLKPDDAALYAATGRWADAKAPLAKWMWLGRHEPALLKAMRWWAGVPEAVAYALTGVLRSTATLAARTLAYDVRTGRYDPHLTAHAGIDPGRLPPVTGATEPVGGLNVDVNGVRRGVPVVIAGHDHAVGAWAAGVRRPGDVADSLGTAEALMVPAETAPDPRTGIALGVTADPSLDGARTVLVGGLPTSGAMLDWALRLVGGKGYGDLPGLLEEVRLPTGIVVEPYLRGRVAPAPDRERRAVLAGLDAAHGPGELLAAVVEGTCLHARWMLDELAAVAGAVPERLAVFGGQVRIPAWMRIKAAVSPVPVEIVRSGDAVCAGAALIAGRAGGSPADVPVLPLGRHPEDPALRAAYLPAYDTFRTRAAHSGNPSPEREHA